MRFKKTIILCGVVLCSVLGAFLGKDTYAARCGDITASYNLSLYNACNWDGVRGALWLNDSSSIWDLSDSITVTASEVAAGSKTIYLHGAVLGSSDDADATYIIIQKSDDPIDFNNYYEWYDADDYSALKGFESRSVARPGIEHPWASQDIYSGEPVALTLDLNELIRLEGKRTSYDISLEVYRCFQGYSPGSSNCYSDASRLNITIPVEYLGYTAVLGTDELCDDLNVCRQKASWKEESGWISSPSVNMNHVIDDCDPVEGCYAQFRHYVKPSFNGATASYRLIRQINRADGTSQRCYSDAFGQTDGGMVTTGCKSDGEGTMRYKVMNNNTGINKSYVKLYPGDKVCDVHTWFTRSQTMNSDYSNGRSITSCVEAKSNLSFQGRSNVWDASYTTDWFSSGNKDATYYIENCDAVKGCNVALSHHLKRLSGSGITQYDIIKKTNGWDREPTIIEEPETITDGSFVPYVTVLRDTYTLYPGEKICETLNFSSKGDDNKDGHGTVCAVALGTADSNITMKVKNSSLKDRDSGNQYAEFGDVTYAKPGDKVELKATYSALLSYVPDLRPDVVKINNGGDNDNPGRSGTLREIFNSKVDPGWQKGFAAFGGDGNTYKTYFGDGERYDDITIGSEAGTSLEKIAKTNPEGLEIYKSVWTTPKSVTFGKNGDGKMVANVDTGSISDNAFIRVPYNFKNSICILKNGSCQGDEGTPVVYAGKNESIRYKITVEDRPNALLADTYATNVKHARWRVSICDSVNGCEIKAFNDDVEFSSGGLSDEVGVDIPDLPAGTDVTITAMVYPKDSRIDYAMAPSDWEDDCPPSEDSCWNASSVTYKVAKRPNFQVWGGNVSANTIDAKSIRKTTIDKYPGEARRFGSWAELAVVGGEKNDEMASGAGFGYSGLELKAEPGGNGDGIYNKLTFGGWSNVEIPTVESVRTSLKLKEEDDKKDVDLMGGEFDKTTLFYITGNTPITGNITIKKDDDGKVPRVVIYSSGNINIDCGVGRLDAILIANGDINTCYTDDPDVNLATYGGAQKRLIINGAIKTVGTLRLNRTFGAATGDYSIEPAEIINYDNNMLFIGGSGSDSLSVDPSSLVTQHMRELAPRY